MNYWLLKSEPSVFSIDDLERSPKKTTAWDGIRNYQARNFMRDGMKKGDRAIFYHSSADPAAAVGIVEITKEAYPDPTQFDPNDDHFDPKSDPSDPTWLLVDVKLVRKFERPLTLAELKKAKGLEKMELLRKGSRLSVQPVTAAEWETIEKISAATASR